VRVRKAKDYNQLSFPGISDSDVELRVEQITRKFLEVIRAAARGSEGERELTEAVPNEEYRGAFLKLTRELAPPLTGKSFNEVEIKSSSDIESRPVILVPNTREVIKSALKKSEPEILNCQSIESQNFEGLYVVYS
jgi:hypothetical protein